MYARTSRKARRIKAEKRARKEKIRKASLNLGILSFISASGFGLLPQTQTQVSAAVATMTRAQYIDHLASFAQSLAKEQDLWASVMIAQAILESNWGLSSSAAAPYHNLFGVTLGEEHEDFQCYTSFAESFSEYAHLLKNVEFGYGPYYAGAWRSNTQSFEEATAWLQGRFSADPNYANNLNQLIRKHELTRFDSFEDSFLPVHREVVEDENNQQRSSTYQVLEGDSLTEIAQEYQTTVGNLKVWNGLKSSEIFAGQFLIVDVHLPGL